MDTEIKIGTLCRMAGNIAPAFIQRGETDPKQIAQQTVDVVEKIVILVAERFKTIVTKV